MADLSSSILVRLNREVPFQPATNFWRGVELSVLINQGFPFLSSARKILDLGCGDGRVMKILREYLPEKVSVTGVDVDPLEADLARQQHTYDDVLQGDGERINLPDSSFDAIISNSVLEHIKPIEAVLGEASRLLCKEGVFIATVPGPDFHECLFGPLGGGSSREAYLQDMDRRLLHYRYWGEAEWRYVLQKVGLTLIRTVPYLDEKQTRRWELISRLTGGLLYSLNRKIYRPIEIQRKLKVRSQGIPLFLAQIFSHILGLGLGARRPECQRYSCLLFICRKE